MRHMPLGCDRNHDRYWFFPSAAPGLYIEKGLLDVLALDFLAGSLMFCELAFVPSTRCWFGVG